MSYPLGTAEQTITAALGEGELKEKDGERGRKYRLRWLDRDWEARMHFVGGVLSFGLAKGVLPPKGEVEDVPGTGRAMCAALGPQAVPVVGWSGEDDRYEHSFRDWAKSLASVGCEVKTESVFAISGASTDTNMLVVGRIGDESGKKMIEFFDSGFVPFDWDHAPHIDDPVNLGSFRYIVDSIVPKSSVGKNPFLKTVAADGATYLVVRYSIENTGMETATAFANDLFIRDTQGRVFRRASDATRAIAAEERIDVLLSQLQPSVPRKQVAVFEVPKVVLDRFDLVIPEKGVLGSGEAVLPFTFWAPSKK